MGIPAAFRWLSNKYPKIISPVVEEQSIEMEDGMVIPVDATRPNPNGEEFDNLYLDMNGIVHPCSHPEDKPAPKDEEEMMVEIFKYTDRVVNMVRPRRILMIAVDGVAPRAKMNQQRSRRFRAAQEAKDKEEDKQQLLTLLKKQNKGKPLTVESIETVTKKAFDSNSITPGTPFMDILAASLRYWCAYKLNTDPAWANLKVIISDASIPGEGEHKIMDFVRSQRLSPDHDPNTRHVIYGLDADLIMLGLVTHEPHFRVLREDVFFQEGKARMCKLCGQNGHDAKVCQGTAKVKDGEFDEKDKAHPLKPFIWLHVSALREYLAIELDVPGLPFRFDLERAIDDWVFMCFFVGNDFLPHLPALEIRENGIDTLNRIWRENLASMGGYVTKDGHVDMKRAQVILSGLAQQEDSIFRRRKEQEDRRQANNKRRKLQDAQAKGFNNNNNKGLLQEPPKLLSHEMLVNRGAVQTANLANKSAASVLKSRLQASAQASPPEPPSAARDQETTDTAAPTLASALGKRKADLVTADDATSASEDEGPIDEVRLWEDGYADRYYEKKFHVDPKDIAFRHKVAHAYVEGLAWVLRYYSQGCPSWEWYYPYHYAPFAADFVDLEKVHIHFAPGRTLRPFEQLMSVLPAASRHAIPEVFHDLMTSKDSEIIDFYPEEFEIDLNGKKMAWQGVALLPFIDMERLLSAMATKYLELSPEDQLRNDRGRPVLLISDSHPTLYEDITRRLYAKKKVASGGVKLDPRLSNGLSGLVDKAEGYTPHGSLVYPLSRSAFPDVDYDRSLSVFYELPSSSHPHKSMLLRGVQIPTSVLTRSDVEELRSKARNGSRRGGYRGGAPPDRRNGDYYRSESRDYGPAGNPRSDKFYDGGRGGGGTGRGSWHNNYDMPRQAPYTMRGPYPPGPQAWDVPPPPPPPGHCHPPGSGGPSYGLPLPPPPAYNRGEGGGGSHGGGYGPDWSYGSGEYGQQNYSDRYPPAPPAGRSSRQYNQYRGGSRAGEGHGPPRGGGGGYYGSDGRGGRDGWSGRRRDY